MSEYSQLRNESEGKKNEPAPMLADPVPAAPRRFVPDIFSARVSARVEPSKSIRVGFEMMLHGCDVLLQRPVRVKGSHYRAFTDGGSQISRPEMKELLAALEEFELTPQRIKQTMRQVPGEGEAEEDTRIEVEIHPQMTSTSNVDIRIEGSNKLYIDGIEANLRRHLAKYIDEVGAEPKTSNKWLPPMIEGSAPGATTKSRRDVEAPVRVKEDEPAVVSTGAAKDASSRWSRLWREKSLDAVVTIAGGVVLAELVAYLGLR